MADESKSQADGKSSEEIENLTDEIDARCVRELVIDHAEPADEVLHFVGECKVDLVILGPPESDRRMVFGSTTERLIRESAYAVLAVALGSTEGGRVMRAVRFAGVGRPAQIADVPKPAPGPGQVLVKIGGAGVCHSDLHVMEEDFGFTPPFTLGHENAGWVAGLGGGVSGFKEGDPVAVYGPWGCGRCHACQLSMENYCEHWAEIGGFGGGLGFDGGMADYMLVPAPRLLVPLGDLSPSKAAPLSDAALTPYHAIKRALQHLNADSTVVVMGVGGLGHMAIQLLRVLAPMRIVAADVDNTKLEQAKALGAHNVVNNRNVDDAAERIQQIAGSRGAGLVLDCVGVQPTIDLGARLLGRNSMWTIVGLGGGHHDFHHGSTPYGCSVSIPYWGSRVELMEVIAMARNGRIHAETTEFPLEQADAVYERLKAGQITGRAVLVPQ